MSKTRGSVRYVQSDCAGVISLAIAENMNRCIVFGKPCQIHAVRNLFRGGTFASGLLSTGNQVLSHNNGFRMPYAPGRPSAVELKRFTATAFGRFYLANHFLRPTCYKCDYSNKSAVDLRPGGFWNHVFHSVQLGASIVGPYKEKPGWKAQSRAPQNPLATGCEGSFRKCSLMRAVSETPGTAWIG